MGAPSSYMWIAACPHAVLDMRPTLLESNRRFSRSAECAFASILAHAGLAWLALGATEGGRQIPTDEREARVFFLLPPDRVDVRIRQTEIIQWGKLGGDLEDGMHLTQPGEGLRVRAPAYGARSGGVRSGARGELPFGPPPPFVPDTVFSVLEVDEMVERYDGSAAPVYPRDLLAVGAEGVVQAIYVVDTTGRVDRPTVGESRSANWSSNSSAFASFPPLRSPLCRSASSSASGS